MGIPLSTLPEIFVRLLIQNYTHEQFCLPTIVRANFLQFSVCLFGCFPLNGSYLELHRILPFVLNTRTICCCCQFALFSHFSHFYFANADSLLLFGSPCVGVCEFVIVFPLPPPFSLDRNQFRCWCEIVLVDLCRVVAPVWKRGIRGFDCADSQHNLQLKASQFIFHSYTDATAAQSCQI